MNGAPDDGPNRMNPSAGGEFAGLFRVGRSPAADYAERTV